ncbi:MAG: amidohydrolase family protein [Dehalococcoidia bacterium]|nr:amidohydrolase family protein [Dehalococcoidia bacterium]
MQNVYFDTAASSFLYQPQIYTLVSQLVGADKILFGSDYPLLPQTRLLREINSAALTEEEKRLITGENARKLLGI